MPFGPGQTRSPKNGVVVAQLCLGAEIPEGVAEPRLNGQSVDKLAASGIAERIKNRTQSRGVYNIRV